MVDNELVEGLLSGELSRLPCGKLDEGTLLLLDDGGGPDLPKLVEAIPVGAHHNHLSQIVETAPNILVGYFGSPPTSSMVSSACQPQGRWNHSNGP